MSIEPDVFRAALGQWPTGVTVVTTCVDGNWHGMTASSFASVSLEPPLVSVALAAATATHAMVASSALFGVSILAKDQSEFGKRFARFDPTQPDRFADGDWITGVTGAPVLADGLAWLDCRVAKAHESGDHTIFVGEVLAAGTPRVTSPLLYHSRTWGQFADQLPESVELVEVTDVEPFGAGPGIEFNQDAGPLEIRERCREAIAAVAPELVRVRICPSELAQANLLTALKSGVRRIDVDPAGRRAITPAAARLLLRGLAIEELHKETSAR